ncbi:hypothetical protein TNCV_4561861 [Trichonephila clavipes]|nr:hypothetical protein TNCV_4561861 [Trichonephila clavipes]
MRGTASSEKIESPGPLNQHKKYDVVISDDLRLAEELPPLSVYVGAEFAAEIKTFRSSSSMEPVGAYRIFERSENHRMLRYTDYYGDGDSKAFDAVKDIYGKILLRS